MEKKRNPFKSGNLKKNNRWSGFQKTVHSEESKPTNSRFKNFGSFNKTNNNYNEKQKFNGKKSKFGKRIYRSKYNKEETFEYFNKQKTATIKENSLLNFIKNETKNNNIKKHKKNNKKNEQKHKQKNEMFTKSEMTKEQKMFITNQYMYEVESDEEIDNNVEEKNEKINKIIEF